jgi:hypothetical protein
MTALARPSTWEIGSEFVTKVPLGRFFSSHHPGVIGICCLVACFRFFFIDLEAFGMFYGKHDVWKE